MRRNHFDHVVVGFFLFAIQVAAVLLTAGCSTTAVNHSSTATFKIRADTPIDPTFQESVERIDKATRDRYGISSDQTSVGVFDFQTSRLAMIHPDRIEYAASVAKIGILVAYFQLHPDAAEHLNSETRHELGLMVKASSNEIAAQFSEQMGLRAIQDVLNSQGFYDPAHGGGIWVGKHYGKSGERIPDPAGGNSHAATVRQLLRFYLLLEQGKLISPAASKTMREIFESPDIPHDQIKFVKGLSGRDVQVIRKWGSWENYLHDTAVVIGPGRHYILVALTHHDKGDEYLADLAAAVDDLLKE